MFSKETVFQGYSLAELSRARDLLANNQIKYKVKTTNSNGSWLAVGSHRGAFGSGGIKPDYERQYEIIVAKEDAEKARYLIRKK